MGNTTSNLVAQIDAWLKSDAGTRFSCVRDDYYKPPEDYCVGCIMKAALEELKSRPVPETSGDSAELLEWRAMKAIELMEGHAFQSAAGALGGTYDHEYRAEVKFDRR